MHAIYCDMLETCVPHEFTAEILLFLQIFVVIRIFMGFENCWVMYSITFLKHPNAEVCGDIIKHFVKLL